MQAIKDVNGELLAALDPNDSVGVLDKFSRATEFFTSPERFERFLSSHNVDWLSVCSPNHLHDVHTRLGLNNGANVLCEKPLCLSPWNLDALANTERTTGKRVYTVLQLRHVPKLQSLQFKVLGQPHRTFDVKLKYVTPRGRWYHQSWKGDVEKSGGLVTNIGIHMLDLLLWLFGPCDGFQVNRSEPRRVDGLLKLARAHVDWKLSIEPHDSPDGKAYRSLTIDGEEVVFDGFDLLHSTVYEETLNGRGHGIEAARPAVELAYKLR